MSVYRYGKDLKTFLKNYRAENNLSQSQLGRMLGCTQQHINNLEHDRWKNPTSTIVRLLTYLDDDRKKFLLDLMAEAAFNKAAKEDL